MTIRKHKERNRLPRALPPAGKQRGGGTATRTAPQGEPPHVGQPSQRLSQPDLRAAHRQVPPRPASRAESRREQFRRNSPNNSRTARTARGSKEQRGFKMQSHYPALFRWGWARKVFTADHVQRRFELNSPRTARYQLKQLSAQRYIGRVPVNAVRPNDHHVFVTMGRGLTVGIDEYEARTGQPWNGGRRPQPRRPTRGYGLLFIDHERGITDFDVALWQTAQESVQVRLAHSERRLRNMRDNEREAVANNTAPVDLTRLAYCNRAGEPVDLRPDARHDLIHYATSLDVCFFENDNGNESAETVVEKLINYRNWEHSPAGHRFLAALAAVYGVDEYSVRILLNVSHRLGEGSDDNYRLAKLLVAAAASLPPDFHSSIWLTTDERFQQQVDQADPLSAKLWHRLHRVSAWLSHLDETETTAQHEAHLRRQLDLLPQHRLLPN